MRDYYAWAGPLIRLLDPERAHHLTIAALRCGLVPRAGGPAPRADVDLTVPLWGLRFPNPVGLAAGFDKDAEVADAMLAMGFGFVEVGTLTLRPQPGNPRPRLFRLPEDGAVINRFGFNNQGVAAARERLARRARSGGLVGGNIGPNRDAAEPAAACAEAAAALAPLVDYLVVNVSSPNTPGLRDLQQAQPLAELLACVREARDAAPPGPSGHRAPLLVKVAPDLLPDECAGIAAVVLAAGIDGLIATNTTVARPPCLRSRHRGEAGGLSGRPLLQRSTEVLALFYRLTHGRLPLIGAGGIASGADAYAKIRAGASLLQLYTALVYHGPGLVQRILCELAELLHRDGFARLTDAVGADVAAATTATAGTAP